MKKYLHCLIVVALIAIIADGPTQSKAPQAPKAANVGISAAQYQKPAVEPPAQPTQAIEPPAVVVAPAPAGCSGFLPLVQQYSWPVSTAMAIMRAESGCNPSNVSPAYINWDGVSDYGLFQLHGIAILDPSENVAYAYYHKYLPAGGFSPWTTFTSGKYLMYL